jgi:hypothetical protein
VRFRVEQRFDRPPAVIEDALLDPAFLAALARLPRLGAPEVLSSETDGDVVHQQVRHRFTGDLAPAVTAVVDPDRLTWVEDTTYDRRSHRGDHRIRPDHYAGRLKASYTTRVEPAGDGTRRLIEGEVVVRFPLVGSRVEKAIVSGLTDHAHLEAEVLEEWLRNANQG